MRPASTFSTIQLSNSRGKIHGVREKNFRKIKITQKIDF